MNLEELRERRRKGLCFNCDKRFVPGHNCKRLFYIEGYYPEGDVDVEEEEAETEEEEEPKISVHALSGLQIQEPCDLKENWVVAHCHFWWVPGVLIISLIELKQLSWV